MDASTEMAEHRVWSGVMAMGHVYAQTMFSEAARKLQEMHGSREVYGRVERLGASHSLLTENERSFIAERDSFYVATVTEDGWPYIQHRGGPKGFLRVVDAKTLAFADLSGNRQYITAGNVATNDKVSLFLMDYPHQTRLKVIGHMRAMEVDGSEDATVMRAVEGKYENEVERVFVIDVVAYDWNCPQHITPRYTCEEWEEGMRAAMQRHEARESGL